MNQENGSKTAIGAAMLRAAHQLIDGEEKLINDAVILKLLGPEIKDYVLTHSDAFFTPGSIGMRTHIVLRSRYAEDCLKQAYQNGVRQFLILGAGLDTFAYRQPEWAKNLNIIEADHPASHADKAKRLKDAGVTIPENLSFIETDLEADDLTTIFKNSKLNFSQPIFTACLGVLIYLTKDTVDKIFRFLGTLPSKSEFVFTASQKKSDEYRAVTAERVAQAGEPWLTYFDEDELIAQLKSCGFRDAAFLTPDKAKSLYFENNYLKIPPPTTSGIVRAII